MSAQPKTPRLAVEITAKIDDLVTYTVTMEPGGLPEMEALVERISGAVSGEAEAAHASAANALRALFPEDPDLSPEEAAREAADRLLRGLAEVVQRERVEVARLATGGLVTIDDQGRAITTALEDAKERHPAPTLGDVVREQRRSAGLSLRDLAARCGMTPTKLGEVERGVLVPEPHVLGLLFYQIALPTTGAEAAEVRSPAARLPDLEAVGPVQSGTLRKTEVSRG